MKKSTEKILAEIRKERQRQSALTRSDLEKEYEALKQSGYEIEHLYQLKSDLKGSKQIQYHYELVLEDQKRPKNAKLHIDESFIGRGKEGRDFLFQILEEKDKDENEAVHAAYMIAESLNYYVSADENKKLIPYLICYTALDNTELRRKAIIALGWIFTPEYLEKELQCLTDHLLHDPDSLCRAWSASAFMQLSFHHAPIEIIQKHTLPVFQQFLKQETDDFAVGVAIETIAELWKKNFRLSSVAVERRDHDRIESARKSAARFLEKTQIKIHSPQD